MHRALTAALLAAAALLPAPAATAHPGYHYEGRCGYAIANTPPGSSTWSGVMEAWVVATDAAGAPAPNVPITVECRPYVDGIQQPTAFTASGTGAAGGAATWTFPMAPDGVLVVCDVVTVGGFVHQVCA